MARAIRFAADNGAHVINMSLGAFATNTATKDALTYAVDKGVFVAVALGNTREAGNQPNVIGNIAPSLGGAVTVGAADGRRDGVLPTTSPAGSSCQPRVGYVVGRRRLRGHSQQTLDPIPARDLQPPRSRIRSAPGRFVRHHHFQVNVDGHAPRSGFSRPC